MSPSPESPGNCVHCQLPVRGRRFCCSGSFLAHSLLQRAGVDSRLHRVPGGLHGGFSRAETHAIFETIDAFLAEHGLGGAAATSQEQ